MVVADRCMPYRVVISAGGIVNCCFKISYLRTNGKFPVAMLCVSGWPVFLTVPIIVL